MTDKKDLKFLGEMRKKESEILSLRDICEVRALKIKKLEAENTELKHNIMHKNKYTRIVQDEAKRLTAENAELKEFKDDYVSVTVAETAYKKLEAEVKRLTEEINISEIASSINMEEYNKLQSEVKRLKDDNFKIAAALLGERNKLADESIMAIQRIKEQETEISDMTMRRDNLQLEVEEIKERASAKSILAIIDYYILSNLDPDDTTKMSEFISKNIKEGK